MYFNVIGTLKVQHLSEKFSSSNHFLQERIVSVLKKTFYKRVISLLFVLPVQCAEYYHWNDEHPVEVVGLRHDGHPEEYEDDAVTDGGQGPGGGLDGWLAGKLAGWIDN